MNFRRFKFFLTEKINFVQTDYGNKYNFTNRRFTKEHGDIFTFFLHEGNEVVVELSGESLNFAILDKRGEGNYQHSRSDVRIKNIQEFYGKILYIFRDMVKDYNIDFFKIYAHPTEYKTSKLYSAFIRNPSLMSIIKGMGFEYFYEKTQEEDGLKFKVYFFSKSKKEI